MQYETVIGLEIHVQMNTASKAFCADDAAFGGAPNSHVSAVSLAHPGTLPRLNRKAVESAARLGLAMDLQVNLISTFDRKNYFYADLPKGYQITQDRLPIAQRRADDTTGFAGVRIHHIHMEEDAGKSIHDQDPRHSLIDLNRAGVPLMEIVTEPDLRSAEQTAAFIEEIRRLVRWLDISDGNMEEGSLRCDVNISVRPMGQTEYGERCEIKNVNSMRFAKKAIEYEVGRQIALLEAGQIIQRETRGFDPASGETFSLRDKEDAHDYRYFPEPDLPPVRISPERFEQIKAAMPDLPQQLAIDFQEKYQLSPNEIIPLLQERPVADYFKWLVQHNPEGKVVYKSLANLLINKIKPWADSEGVAVTEIPVAPAAWVALMALVQDGKVSNTVAFQQLFPEMIAKKADDPEQLAVSLNLIQTSDASLIEQLADQVLAALPDKVAEYKKGKKGLIGLFMGELMKLAKGKADPQVANKILSEKLK